MSESAAPRRASLPKTQGEDLRAALIWDVPQLRRSRAPGTSSFLRVMQLIISGDVEPQDGVDPLAIAAHGLALELRGHRELARSVYNSLIEFSSSSGIELAADDIALVHLLGFGLLAWSGPADLETTVENAREELGSVEDEVLAGMYLAKLATFAADQGRLALATQLLDASHERLPSSRPLLRWRVANANAHLGGAGAFLVRPEGFDPLADPVWLLHETLDAAQADLEQRAKALVTNPWARGWTFGHTPVDRTQAALNQAEWAGALWMLPALRRQLGAQVLAAGGRNAEEWVYGTAMWVLGGSLQVSAAVRTAEAHFDSQSVTELLSTYLRNGDRVRDEERYVETLLALWDVLPDSHVLAALNRYAPELGEDEARAAKRRALWCVLAVRASDEWMLRYRQLPEQVQRDVLSSLGTGLVQSLPEVVRAELGVRCAQRLQLAAQQDRSEPEDIWDVAAALWTSLPSGSTRKELELRMSHAEPLVRLRVGTLQPELRTRLRFSAALRDVWKLVRDEAEAARQGRMSVPVVSRTARLSQALAASRRSKVTQDIVENLVAIATDSAVLADFRADVMQGLALVARQWKSGGAVFVPIRSVDTQATHGDYGGASTELLQALRLSIVAVADPKDDDVAALLAASRSSDARVRELAVVSSAERLGRKPDGSALAAIVASGMHDPERHVLIAAIRALNRLAPVPPLLGETVAQRLPALFDSGDSDVRAEVCRAIQGMGQHGPVPRGLQRVIRAAQGDRSWKVRTAAGASIG